MLDIRNNGGGLFPAGVDVAKMWMNDGTIVLIADSSGVRDSYDADGTALSPTYPLSVLVNRGTASASEVYSQVACFLLVDISFCPERGWNLCCKKIVFWL